MFNSGLTDPTSDRFEDAMNIQACTPLSPEQRQILLDLALKAIRHRLETGANLKISAENFPPELQTERASFVTLNRQSNLRGRSGHLAAIQPLVEEVADNAGAAAFRDPRFPELRLEELADLEIHISVLTPSEPITFTSEADLLLQIRPNVDGLILAEGMRRGTFLPSVWEQLPQPREFLHHLKQKAGLPADYWSDDIEVFRYETESFP
jgi:AmmeMemoRadiSam system protein A